MILCGKWLVRTATAAFIHSSNTPKVMTGTQTDESTQQSAQTYGNNTKKQAKITFKLKQVPTNGSHNIRHFCHNISMCRIWLHAPKRLEKSSAARVAGVTSCCCCRHLLWQVGTRTNLRLGSEMLAAGCFTPAAVDQWRASLLLVRTRCHCPKDFPRWTALIAHDNSGWNDKQAKLPSGTFRLDFILMLHRSTSLQGAPQSTLTNEHDRPGAFLVHKKRKRKLLVSSHMFWLKIAVGNNSN